MNACASKFHPTRLPRPQALHFARQFLPLALALALTGCTLQRPKRTHVISVKVPQAAARQFQQNRAHSTGVSAAAAAGAGLRIEDEASGCFVVNVTGPGISNSNPSAGCAASSTSFTWGRVAGWVSVAEGSLTIEVPEGSARKIQVLARLSASGCGSFSEDLADSGYEIFEFGSTTVDLFEDKTVTITLNTAGLNAPVLACGADDITSTAGVWDESQWDTGAVWAE